jgi:hypothetical protein
VFTGENPPEYEVFPFLWFLTCLFHDFGYEYEINKKYFSKIDGITSLKKYFRIRHHLLDQNISYLPKDLIRSIPIYYQYKIASRMEIDHGIVAGLCLYDKLVKNRLLKKSRRQKNNDDLLWDDCLDEQYALAGGTIATHNIWFPDTKSKSTYIKYGLTDLINRHPITPSEAPLLFLLGLVDTIDPVKLFGSKHKKDSDVLKSVLIDFYKNEIRLSIDSRARLPFNKLRKRCKDLEPWLAVNVFDRDSCIYIRF